MIRKIFPLMVGVLLGIGALAAFASAAPPVVPAGADSDNPNIIAVAKWDRKRHGSRCEYRRAECRHFYRGYYYETPWWTVPFAVGEGIGSNRHYDDDEDYFDDDDGGWDNSHIEWCLKRYRSYNPRNNTWVSYSGRVRECISPF